VELHLTPPPQGQRCHVLLPLIVSLAFGCNVIHGEAFLANPVTEIIYKIRFVTVPIVAGSGGWGGGWGRSGVTSVFCSHTVMHIIRRNAVRQILPQP
jgi:hypothetical protein